MQKEAKLVQKFCFLILTGERKREKSMLKMLGIDWLDTIIAIMMCIVKVLNRSLSKSGAFPVLF